MAHLNLPNILTYFYTKGKQLSIKGQEYIGYFHTKHGIPYSEGVPSPTSVRLYRYSTNQAIITYDDIRKDQFKKLTFSTPHYSPPIISKSEYENGEITRYFVRHRTSNSIIEINSRYARLYGKTGGIDNELYELIQLPWKVAVNNFTKEIEKFNSKSVARAASYTPVIRDYITNFFEYSIVDIIP